MRVAIVNDLRLAVEALKRTLAAVPGTSLAWVASDGQQALERCAADRPDLILMDLVMPVMDGVEATRRIMRETPCAILVVTATLEGHLERVYNALGAGALDAVQGPVLGPDGALDGAPPVVRKIRTLMRLQSAPEASARAAPGAALHGPPATPGARGARRLPLLALGASTGGPDALATVLRALPRDLPGPVALVQHLDAEFVPGLVDWLGAQTGRDVRAAQPGDALVPGRVLVACTNDHLVLGADQCARYTAEPQELPYRPSVDVFFHSLVAHWPGGGAAALLTGMGRDGAEGLLALRRAGWRTFAQDEASSVVYGMPRAARDRGAAEQVLPLAQLGAALGAALAQLAVPPAPDGALR